MPDQTARDAVASAIKKAREFRFAQAWRTEDGEVYGERRQASDEETVDAVLAVLGIPPDTPVDTIRAGLLHARHPAWTVRDVGRCWMAWSDTGQWAEGASHAAAVIALERKLNEEAQDST